MFRDSRLGEISGEVLDYLSSREADRRIFQADLLVDRAHLIMLKEQGWITPQECARILHALGEVRQEDLGAGEDVHEAIEAYVLERVGPLGGRMHTGRSRNDEVATCLRLALREEMLGLLEELLAMINALVCIAQEHTESVIPGFTHTQHAQPTTLAHHLLAHADAFLRDMDRLEDAYHRVNCSPLGAAAFASTGFKIDRNRTCQLLGFDCLVENSMDAVSARDFILESLAILSILMVNLSRLAEEMILWSAPEFGYVELDNAFASTSSIMPQKKNPDTAELARAKTGSVLGSLVSGLVICKALPQSYNRDLQEISPHLWRAVDWTRSSLRILQGALVTMRFDLPRLEKMAAEGFSTATELADSLVRKTGMPFRTAHKIVAMLAAQGRRPSMQDLDDAALQLAAPMPSRSGFGQHDLEEALDPRSNVGLRSATGGPAPVETARMAKGRLTLLEMRKGKLGNLRRKVEAALEELMTMQ
jgi:argininosuccinate lyase